MGHSNGLITTSGSGISFLADIAEVLGVGSGDIGTLCTSNNINMWAKCKPIKYASWVSCGNWAVDSQGNYNGIVTPTSVDSMNCAGYNISYNKPTGGSSSPYRALDFDGYNHNSVCPWTIIMPSGNIPTDGTPGVRYARSLNTVTGNVELSDIYPNMYFCVCVEGSYGTYFKTFSVDTTSFTNCSIADCPSFIYGIAGTDLTIKCGMAEMATDGWVTNPGVLHSMSYTGHVPVSTITLVTPVETSWTLGVSFPGVAKPFANFSTTQVSSGTMSINGTWRPIKPTDEYILTSVTYRGVLAYSGTEIPAVTESYPSTSFPSNSCSPLYTGKEEWTDTQGSGTVQFICPIVTGLPSYDEPVTWYYTLNYTVSQ